MVTPPWSELEYVLVELTKLGRIPWYELDEETLYASFLHEEGGPRMAVQLAEYPKGEKSVSLSCDGMIADHRTLTEFGKLRAAITPMEDPLHGDWTRNNCLVLPSPIPASGLSTGEFVEILRGMVPSTPGIVSEGEWEW